MSDEAYISAAPACDIHQQVHARHVPATYDARTIHGPWANLCESCFRAFGIGLGTGKGQRLIIAAAPEPDPQRVRSQVRAALAAGDLSLAEDLLGDGDLSDYL